MSNLEIREGEYGDKVLALEPGGIEAIKESERHGKARNLFATWMSPNLEFATMFVGVLAVAVFGLSFAQSVLAIVIGKHWELLRNSFSRKMVHAMGSHKWW